MSQTVNEKARAAAVMLAIMALLFGGSWPAGKLAVADVPPMTAAAIRFILASLLLWAWARRHPPTNPPTWKHAPLIIALGITGVSGYNVLFLYGLVYAPAADGAIIVPGLAPVMSAVLARVFLNEEVTKRGAVGLGIAFGGLVLVMSPSGGLGSDRFLGDALFFTGATLFAIYSIIGKGAVAAFGALHATRYATTTGALLLIPFALAEGGIGAAASAPWTAHAALAYLGAFGTAVPFVLFYEGVGRIGAASATSFFLLVPVAGVALSVLMLQESLAFATVAGGALVLFGLWLIQRRRERSSRYRGIGALARSNRAFRKSHDTGDSRTP